MASSLRSALDCLASEFAAAVLDAVRGASLEELVAETKGGRRGPGRPPKAAGSGEAKAVASTKASGGRAGRLKRRSAEDIAKALDKIALLVKTHKDGMRAEDIRAKLGMDRKEIPRLLKEGLATRS
jgi:hypothetical protein